jgi:hypothetical protein
MLSLPQPRSGLNYYAVRKGGDAIPRAALRLQGVIHIECLRHSPLAGLGRMRSPLQTVQTPDTVAVFTKQKKPHKPKPARF